MFNIVLALVDYFQGIYYRNVFLLTIKIFKDDGNLLANATFPYKTLKLVKFIVWVTICDVIKEKRYSLKSEFAAVSNLIDLIQFLLICQMLATFSEVEFGRTVFKFRKWKRKFLCCVFTFSISVASLNLTSTNFLTGGRRVRNSDSCDFHAGFSWNN